MDSMIIAETQDKLAKAMEILDKKFATVRAGRANPSSLDGIVVSYYGVMTPLKQLATISVPEARQLLIKPFDRSCLKDIEKAILSSNLGYNPGNDGETIRIVIPELTEERRKELVKQVGALAEEGRVAIRNIRRDALDDIKNGGFSEDEEKRLEKEIQDLVDKSNKKTDVLLKEKDEELLTI